MSDVQLYCWNCQQTLEQISQEHYAFTDKHGDHWWKVALICDCGHVTVDYQVRGEQGAKPTPERHKLNTLDDMKRHQQTFDRRKRIMKLIKRQEADK